MAGLTLRFAGASFGGIRGHWTLLLLLILTMWFHLASAFTAKLSTPTRLRQLHRLDLAATNPSGPPQKVAIVGGGLAGLSTAYHLLEQAQTSSQQQDLHVTILDKEPIVGEGGASAVAGG